MTRFSSEQILSPDGTNITGAATSNSVKTETAKDARIFVDVSSVPGGQTLDVFVQISPDNIDFADIKAFNEISTATRFVLALSEAEVGTFTRVRYLPSGAGPFVLGTTIEKKQGG